MPSVALHQPRSRSPTESHWHVLNLVLPPSTNPCTPTMLPGSRKLNARLDSRRVLPSIPPSSVGLDRTKLVCLVLHSSGMCPSLLSTSWHPLILVMSFLQVYFACLRPQKTLFLFQDDVHLVSLIVTRCLNVPLSIFPQQFTILSLSSRFASFNLPSHFSLPSLSFHLDL